MSRKRKPKRQVTDLYKFLKSPSRFKSLNKHVEKEAYENVFKALDLRFPTCPITHMPEDIILETGDILSQMVYEGVDFDNYKPTVFIDYLEMTLDYLKKQQTLYHQRYDEAKQRVTKRCHDEFQGHIPVYYNRKDRQKAGYTPEVIDTVLDKLNIDYSYIQYEQGYYRRKYHMNQWLCDEFTKTLALLKEDLLNDRETDL